jgi:glutaminyl-tRNA synthetase
MSEPTPSTTTGNFIRELIAEDTKTSKHDGRVATRFPPEPNGYLHIGHAKAMCLNFGLARDFQGSCNLRFDDTNPITEDVEYVDSIQNDIKWLGFEWNNLYYASDYFEQLYQYAELLIQKGLAYVDSLDEEQIREYRGNYYKKGTPSPFRDRTVAENLQLFRDMRAGKYKDGQHVLRAKIDLNSQNMNMRDPLLYRIRHAPHHRTGTNWCIYPMYDYAHPLSDAIEKITHSLCTLEFEAHRPLYDWAIAETGAYPSQQIEFARLFLTYTVMSKRKLLELVQKKVVNGWDDPRMPTLAGLRRRGYTAAAIRNFCERIGVSKADSVVDVGLLEHCLREDLNKSAPRLMAVLKPLELIIENFPEGQIRELDAPLSPEAPAMGSRKVPFSRTLYIEQDDFRTEVPQEVRKSFAFHRLVPGRDGQPGQLVRLRYACIIRCTRFERDFAGNVKTVYATMVEGSWGGNHPEGTTVPGTIHWVSAAHSKPATVRLYDRLFSAENPGTTEGKSFLEEMNPHSLEAVTAQIEPYLEKAKAGEHYQFERLGYFVGDPDGGFNRAVTLKDTWAKIEKKVAQQPAAPKPPKEAKKDKSVDKKVETGPAAEVGIEEFQKLDLRVALVKEAGLVEGADKLIRVLVDLGDGRDRQIFAGLRQSYPDPAALVGKRVVVIANLRPRQMKFGLSEGMILAAGKLVISAGEDTRPGDKVS